MAGRYGYSLPDPRPRDGWFRIGTLDVTTTILVVLVGAISMVLYAIDPSIVFTGAYVSYLVHDGELWRIATWPLANQPGLFEVIDLVVLWWIGNQLEEELGKKPMAVLLGAMTIIPASIVALINLENHADPSRWVTATAGTSLIVLALIVVFGLHHREARFFFGLPFWAVGLVFVGLQVLQLVGDRAWATLLMLLLVLVVALVGVRQRGMLDNLTFIPRVAWLSGGPRSPYGEVGSARPRAKKGRGRTRGKGRGSGDVVAGPWGGATGPGGASGGLTPLEQAELDVLLDRISATGIDSLTKGEKARLQDLSKRMRGS